MWRVITTTGVEIAQHRAGRLRIANGCTFAMGTTSGVAWHCDFGLRVVAFPVARGIKAERGGGVGGRQIILQHDRRVALIDWSALCGGGGGTKGRHKVHPPQTSPPQKTAHPLLMDLHGHHWETVCQNGLGCVCHFDRQGTATSPRMVTCELSRVCWLRRNQHNRQHMQITRRRGKACQEPRRP